MSPKFVPWVLPQFVPRVHPQINPKSSSPKFIHKVHPQSLSPQFISKGSISRFHPSAHSGVKVLPKRLSFNFYEKCPLSSSVLPLLGLTRSAARSYPRSKILFNGWDLRNYSCGKVAWRNLILQTLESLTYIFYELVQKQPLIVGSIRFCRIN